MSHGDKLKLWRICFRRHLHTIVSSWLLCQYLRTRCQGTIDKLILSRLITNCLRKYSLIVLAFHLKRLETRREDRQIPSFAFAVVGHYTESTEMDFNDVSIKMFTPVWKLTFNGHRNSPFSFTSLICPMLCRFFFAPSRVIHCLRSTR